MNFRISGLALEDFAQSPYASSGPIFIRRNAEDTRVLVNEAPDQQRRRLLRVPRRSHASDPRRIRDAPRSLDEFTLQPAALRVAATVRLHNACRAGPAHGGGSQWNS
jgi:hypothetical protein